MHIVRTEVWCCPSKGGTVLPSQVGPIPVLIDRKLLPRKAYRVEQVCKKISSIEYHEMPNRNTFILKRLNPKQ